MFFLIESPPQDYGDGLGGDGYGDGWSNGYATDDGDGYAHILII